MAEKNKKRKDEKRKDERARVWGFIAYPDSVPQNWRDILDNDHLSWVESPLHDKDINADGTVKKPHWHIMLFFEGKKSLKQIESISDSVNASEVIIIQNPKGMARYLIHYDNPEKFQYKREEIICHGGAEVDSYFEMSASSKFAVLTEIYEFILDSEIENFADFIRYCLENNEYNWLEVASNKNTLAINKLIDAVFQKRVSKQSGEVVENTLDKKIAKVKEMKEKGVKNSVIANTVGISVSTVKRYLKK